MTSSLIDLLKAFLRDYENIEDLYEQGNIYSLVSELIYQERNEHIPIDTPEGYNDRDAFWRKSTSALLQTFNDNFKILETDEDLVRKETYLNFAENMKIIKNRQRIDIENINDNFKLIVSGLQMITDELFIGDGSNLNKYLSMFQGIYNELLPLWENVLYLWIAFLLKEREAIETPIVKYVYLNESDFINNRKFDAMSKDITDITIDDVIDKIECYIDEYPNSHLCIIPIIRLAAEENRYGIEAYPGIFYHSPSFNSQLFKCQHKFMYYSFVDMGISESSIPFNPFYNGTAARFVEAGYQNTTNCLNLSNISYGYRIYGDHLYYATPLSNISNIKEIIPKKYYSAVRSFIDGEFFIYNGALGIYNFKIKYQDVVSNNVNSNEINIAYYEPVLSNANFIVLSLDDNLMTTDKRYILKDSIRLEQHKNSTVEKELTKIRNFRDRIGDTIGQHKFYFPYYEGECISGIAQSIEEDYSYLIEYIPLKYNQTSSENTHIRDSSYNNLNTYINSTTLLNPTSLKTKDNDLLEKHVAWDDARNNILEDKFVLRIGQHIETENAPSNSNLIPNEFKTDKKIKYFDYTSALDTSIDEKETVNNVVYYNSGTTEVGAYLNIPFIKNPNKRLQFYPDFLSHNFGSDNLAPLTSIEYRENSNKPEYFSYDKVFRDYPIERTQYFQIYTSDGKETFEDNNWCIKMVEVIGQEIPTEDAFFTDGILPPHTCASMESLYQYYNSHKNNIKSDMVAALFSQLCPTKTSSPSSSSAVTTAMESSVGGSFKPMLTKIFGETKAIALCEKISTILLSDISQNRYISTYTKEVAEYTIASSQAKQKINFSFQIHGPQNLLQELQTIDSGWGNPEPDTTSYRYFYKTYNDTKLDGTKLKEYRFPRHQIDFNPSNGNIPNYDECLLNYINTNGEIKQQYIYNGFACRHRVFPAGEGITAPVSGIVDEDHPGTLNIRFSFFGANIPFHDPLSSQNYAYPEFWDIRSSPLPDENPGQQNDRYNRNGVFTEYYSYINPGTELYLSKTGIGTFSSIETSIGTFKIYTNSVAFPDDFSPFINMLSYKTYKLNNNNLIVTKNRQYPHIYLLTNKTLFINKNLFKTQKNNNINYQCFSNSSKIKDLASYFTVFSNADLQKTPYPFPSSKKVIESSSSSSISGWDYLANQINFNYPVFYNGGGVSHGDPRIIGMLAEAAPSVKAAYENNDKIYAGIYSPDYTYQVTPGPGYIQQSTTAYQIYSDSKWRYFLTEAWNLLAHGRDGYAPDEFKRIKPISNKMVVTNTNIDTDTEENYTIYQDAKSSSAINLDCSYNSTSTAMVNLQIITHYFGPNGSYARKVMTRKLTNTTVTSDDHFVWDGTTNKLLYKEWTNNWEVEYKNQSTYNSFKNSLENKEIFKQSSSIISPSGVAYDFETYPNTGLSSEGSHQES